MSWVEKIKEQISITTGDNKTYTPLYVITTKTVDYNIAEFEFPNIEGTLVKRSKQKGARYDLEIIFQGEDHLDKMVEFENSNKDSRAWQISHPIYGLLNVQPTSLNYDPTGLNTTKITGQIIETISEDYPNVVVDAPQQIEVYFQEYNEFTLNNFSNSIDVQPEDLDFLKRQTKTIYDLGSGSVKSGTQSNEYFNLFNKANTAILNGFSDVSTMITAITDVLVYPYIFENSIKDRFLMFKNQLDTLNNSVPILTSKSDKLIYETNTGSILAAQCLSVNNVLPNDFDNIDNVLDTMTQITSYYNTYIANLDLMQGLNGAIPGVYMPNYSSVNALSILVNFTVSNLMSIALNAKTQRTYITEKEINPLLLAHRFYGLDPDDENYIRFLEENTIVLTNLLLIKKGVKVYYYI